MDTISLNDLPNELLVEIFKYLPLESVLACECVCRLWNRLSRDASVWNNLSITYSGQLNQKTTASKMLHILSSHNIYVRCIKIQYVIDYSQVMSLLKPCVNLIKIELSMCNVDAQFVDDIKMWPNLKFLHFPITFPSSIGKKYNFQYDYHKRLTSVCLPDFALTPANFNSLANCKNLRHLLLRKVTSLSRENVKTLLLTYKDTIESFQVHGAVSIDDEMFELISGCPSLKDLAIIHCDYLSDKALFKLSSLVRLERLLLWNNSTFSETGLIKTFSNPVLFILKRLSLSRIKNVTPYVVHIISNNYKSLTFVAFYQCPLVLGTDSADQLRIKFPNVDVVL